MLSHILNILKQHSKLLNSTFINIRICESDNSNLHFWVLYTPIKLPLDSLILINPEALIAIKPPLKHSCL